MKISIKLLLILLIVGFFSFSCGSSTNVTKPINQTVLSPNIEMNYEIGEIEQDETEAPNHFLSALKSYVIAGLKKRNLTDKETGKRCLINITIKKYRMRMEFVKKTFGFLAGDDGVKSQVKVVDLDTKEVIGESKVSTTNITKRVSMDDIARMHANEIVRFLAGENK